MSATTRVDKLNVTVPCRSCAADESMCTWDRTGWILFGVCLFETIILIIGFGYFIKNRFCKKKHLRSGVNSGKSLEEYEHHFNDYFTVGVHRSRGGALSQGNGKNWGSGHFLETRIKLNNIICATFQTY